MNLLVFIVSLIFIKIIPTTHSQDPPAKNVLGISACSYNGKTNPIYECSEPVVPIEKLPKECTAFVYESIFVDDKNVLADLYGADEYLKQLLQAGEDVHLMYGHNHQQEWSKILKKSSANGGAGAAAEMKSLKAYLDQHIGIKGIILINLLTDGNTTDIPVTKDLKAYIDIMKEHFPDLSIGIDLNGESFNSYYRHDPIVDVMDFSVVDPSVDFYVLDFLDINDCSEELRNLGPTPIRGNSETTLENVLSNMLKAKIPKAKTHYFFSLSGKSIDDGYSMCEFTYTRICQKEEGFDTWCADTQQSFRDKGNFAKVNGTGFIARRVDLNDPDSVCQCGFPFPAFHYLLDGFNGITTPTPCPLFDRA